MVMAVRILVALAWMYVVVLMAAAEATAPNGSLLGAFFTFLLYGVGPLALALYLLGTPARRRARRAAAAGDSSSSEQPDRRGHAAGDAIAPEREEP
jgi:hypothetical protein